MRRLVGALIAVNVLAALVLGAMLGTSAARPTPSCAAVVADFRRSFPAVLAAAGEPSIGCAPGASSGSGGYSAAENHVAINTNLSPDAKAAHFTDKAAYWRRALAHEIGHAYAAHHGMDGHWGEYAQIRGITESDTVVPQEDYAETFALSLGWMMPDCYGPVPYCFQNSAGHPTAHQLERLQHAGLMPTSRR